MAIKPLIYFACVIVLAAYVLLSGIGNPPAPVREGSRAPDFSVRDEDGRSTSLSDLRGSVVFLNFWRTDCEPCLAEMPEMESLANVFKGRKFRMMPVSLDVDPREVARFYRENDLSIPAYLDPGRNVADKFQILGTPETFLIDCEGNIAKYYIGPRPWSSPEMLSLMEELVP